MQNQATDKTLLKVNGLQAGYQASQVLFGVDFDLAAGQVITLLGRNGMGKSTIVKSLTGMIAPKGGSIQLQGQELVGKASYQIGRLGVGLVPEGRHVFPSLTVRENLVATANTRNVDSDKKTQAWTLEKVFALFPRLKERTNQMAGQMSGGEQQMLAIGRAMMTNPKLLVLDEATEGLAPLIRAEIWACLGQLKAQGTSMIVVDKNLKPLLPLADHHYVIEKGRVAWHGDSTALVSNSAVIQQYLSV